MVPTSSNICPFKSIFNDILIYKKSTSVILQIFMLVSSFFQGKYVYPEFSNNILNFSGYTTELFLLTGPVLAVIFSIFFNYNKFGFF